jgi:hypothetical protein
MKIEKGIPIPARTGAKGPRGSKYPFADMEVGDSFALPVGEKETSKAVRARVASSFKRWARNTGATTKVKTFNEATGVRIFLVA